MLENQVLVAGRLPFSPWNVSAPKTEKTEKALNELVAYLHCFLRGHVYTGNEDGVRRVIEQMLEDSHIEEDEITFSFPEDVAQQFRFPASFTIPLEDGAAFIFYRDQVLPQVQLTCAISIDIEDESVKNPIFQELQSIVLQTQYRIKHIRITNVGDTFQVIIGFNQRLPRIKRNVATISDALTCIRDGLL